MYSWKHLFTLTIMVPLAASCTVHPLPDDVTREATFEIVRKIRCEARLALDNLVLELLKRAEGHPPTDKVIHLIEEKNEDVHTVFKRYGHTIHHQLKPVFELYTFTGVGFDFTFTITEENDNQADVNFRLPFNTGTFTLGLKGGKKLERQSERSFQIAETYFDIQADPELSRDECLNVAAKIGNIIYPITGKIGLEEIFRTWGKLASLTFAETKVSKSEAKRFADTLTFTTTLTASANPKITLNPITSEKFRLADASLTSSGTRIDKHKVVVTVTAGERVSTHAEAVARRNSRRDAFRELDRLRTDDFFNRLNERLDLPAP